MPNTPNRPLCAPSYLWTQSFRNDGLSLRADQAHLPEPEVPISFTLPHWAGSTDPMEVQLNDISEQLYAYWLRSFNAPGEYEILNIWTFDGRPVLSHPIDAGHIADHMVFFPIGQIRAGRMPRITYRSKDSRVCAEPLNLCLLCTRQEAPHELHAHMAKMRPVVREPQPADLTDLVTRVVKAVAPAFVSAVADLIPAARDPETIPAPEAEIAALPAADTYVQRSELLPTTLERFHGAGDMVPTLVRVHDPEASSDLRRVLDELGLGFPRVEIVTAVLGAPTELRAPGCSEPVRAWTFMSPHVVCSLQLTVDRRWELHAAPFAGARPGPLPPEQMLVAHASSLLARIWVAVHDATCQACGCICSQEDTCACDLACDRCSGSSSQHVAQTAQASAASAEMMRAQQAGTTAFAAGQQMQGSMLSLQSSWHRSLEHLEQKLAQQEPSQARPHLHPITGEPGHWVCSCCNAQMTDGFGAWRWSGARFEHACPDTHAQAGHMPASFVPAPDHCPPGAGD